MRSRLVLPGAVEAEDQQTLAPADVEGHVVEHVQRAVRLGQVLDLEHRAARRRAAPGTSPSACVGAAAPRRRRPRCARCASRGCAPSTPWWPSRRNGRRSSAGARPRRCRAAILVSRSSSLRRADEVLRVRALVLDERAERVVAGAIEVQHARDRGVEQLEVVADHEQRAAVLREEAEHPVAGVVVEVVGRLVEEEDVAAGEEDPRQLDAATLAAGQHAQRQVEAGRRPDRGRRRSIAPPTRPRSRPRRGTTLHDGRSGRRSCRTDPLRGEGAASPCARWPRRSHGPTARG